MIFDYEDGKLEFFKDLYQEAFDAMTAEHVLMQRRIDQYNGSQDIDGSSAKAKRVRNITYELIESQVTSYIPTPAVAPIMQSTRNERNAKSLEVYLRALRNAKPFERLNDMDERFSPIYGGSVWLVEWDESERTHNTTGDIRYTCLPPTRFVGQPNVYEVEDMTYCFVTFETTKDAIVQKYGVTPEVADEAESDHVGYDDDRTATLYVCYYKDDNGCVCQYIWSGDTELADIDDYYARRRKVCTVCGKDEGECTCEKPHFKEERATEEVITHPVILSDGVSQIPPYSPVIRDGVVVTEKKLVQATDATGQMIIDTDGGIATPMMVEVDVPVMEQTKIPYYTPKVFPIVIRKNISKEDAVFGQSDCDAIRDQQQAINMLETRIMEKLLRASVTPVMPEDARVAPDNSVFGQVIRMAPGEHANQYGVVDTTPNITSDIAQSDRLYEQAKLILGISASFQGQYDSSAQSGRAKQLQIQQAAGRLDSKRRMKNAAYADMDKVTFSLLLAYADEPRPATFIDAAGKRQNVTFNRYDFLAMDDAGEWYYDDRYLFSADASIDPEESRMTIWEEAIKHLQAGAFGNPADPYTLLNYWQNLERAHYPHAREQVERIEKQIEQIMAAQAGGIQNVQNA
ncbi:MAG: hypothetical protein IIW78_03180 [Clostridia bacterium]|nr:hypothetical protein [Clostridia bacterium]